MRESRNPLAEKLRARIKASGPLTVADYMETCLADPEHGYYMTRDPLGTRGDFITAPEISQIFGELIGLWCVQVWRNMGEPEPFALVELGPGRGTLMDDALRAAQIAPGFGKAASIHLVETSPVLRKAQKKTLVGFTPNWHDNYADVADGPSVIVANEFLDALPIRQFVRRRNGWCERLIDTGPDDRFIFHEDPEPASVSPETGHTCSEGDIVELRPAMAALAAEIGHRANASPVAALFLDYGHAVSAPGETFQAMSEHGYAYPLDAPGTRDLTAHVDFQQFGQYARNAGLHVHGPIEQGPFLLGLGLAQRCEQLMKNAQGEQRREIEAGARRLVDPAQMGSLFKAMALAGGNVPAPPGF